MRKLRDLVRMMEDFNATLAAARNAGNLIEPAQAAHDERKRMDLENMQHRKKWAKPESWTPNDVDARD